MLLIRFLLFALSLIVVSAAIAERQLPSIHAAVSSLAVKVSVATAQINSLVARGAETDTDVGVQINKIDDALNKAISDLQNLQQAAPPQISPRPKRSIPNRFARVSTQEKRQTAYEVQVLQTKIVVAIVNSVVSLNRHKLPSYKYYIDPLDGILANQITWFANRMGAMVVTSEVSYSVSEAMDRAGLYQTKAAIAKYNRLR